MSLSEQVSDQIAEWTDDEVMFTAFDVTVALRNAGDRIKHSDVRDVVHQMFNNQDFNTAYQKTSAKIPGTNATAFLFHHLNSDVDEYKPVKPTYTTSAPQASKSPTTSSALVQRQGVRNKQPVNGVLNCAYPKYDGSLTIPSVLLDDAGLKGQKVAIVSLADKITIRADHPCLTSSINNNAPHAETRDPKSDGVLLLPRRILKPLSKSTYTISLSTDGREIYVQ